MRAKGYGATAAPIALLLRVERNVVRIAAHEADVTAVLADLQIVAHEKGAPSFGAAAWCRTVLPSKCPPVRIRIRPGADRLRFAGPEPDRRLRVHHPLAIIGMKVDRHAAEGFAPCRPSRCNNADARSRWPSKPPLPITPDGFLGDQGHAIPQDDAAVGWHQQRSLPDGEGRLDADPGHAVFIAEDVAVVFLQLPRGRPFLPDQRTYCRSSSQMGQEGGGNSVWAELDPH